MVFIPTESPPKVQTLVMHEIHDTDGDMIKKMNIMHDIPIEIVSDIAHIDVVPIEEKNKIVRHCLVEGPKQRSVREILLLNDFDKIEMKLRTQEYKKQQGNNLREFFKSSIDPHAVSYIKI
ncbi:uncharacterized protein LOC109846178 [Asparagus officinalis]|uniref:uncharacterized protein LOC109846178 n=1 Tax=Asparagus officinalis TaxID=4686 RepID=UPI00098E5EB5|nr:uncharacterized protein LOC109846178 [Asparagus officinalis]